MGYAQSVYITKDKILNEISESQIFEYYLGIVPDLNKLYKNPLRNDENPGCKFYIGTSNKLRFRDYATGFDEDFVGVVMTLNKCNYPTALETIAQDFGLFGQSRLRKVSVPKIDDSYIKKEKSKTKFRIRPRKWNRSDATYWSKYYITSKILSLFNVIAVDVAWYEGFEDPFYIHTANDPCYCYIFPDKTIKLYFPFRKEGRFRTNSSYIQGYNMLPEKGEVCVITKSYKDVICLYMFDIPAVAPQAESNVLKFELIKELRERFTDIFTLFDWDRAGIRAGIRAREDYGVQPLFLTRRGPVKVRIDYGDKDISDNIAKYGYWDMIDIIEHAKTELIISDFVKSLTIPF